MPPCIWSGFSLPSRASFGKFAHFLGDLDDALLVGIADHRHHQSVRRVGRKADVVVLLEDQVVAVERLR